jgi:hypothetical protein
LLSQLADECGFQFYTLDSTSPAGRRLAQVSSLPQLPGVYVDLELVAWGQPTRETLREGIMRRLAGPSQT